MGLHAANGGKSRENQSFSDDEAKQGQNGVGEILLFLRFGL
jgi:hypothetical protein